MMTVHGLTMVFLVIVPILAGFGNFLVPLMIGAKDVAFPRLNALSYWLFLFAGIVLYASFFATGGAAQTGWTLYPPLSEQYAGDGVDLAILSLHILTVSPLVGAINFIVTTHRRRARRRARPLAPHPAGVPARRRDQLHRHDPPAAGARDDMDARSALRLDDRRVRVDSLPFPPGPSGRASVHPFLPA